MFSPVTQEAIQAYVYALADTDGKIFYIGKGRGNRVFEHVAKVSRLDPGTLRRLSESEEDDDSEAFDQGPKAKHIATLLLEDQGPAMYIVREGMNDEQALLLEAALISVLDWQMDGALTNQISGHGTGRSGLKTVDELEATKGMVFNLSDLPGISVSHEVVGININKRWAEVRSGKSSLLDVSAGDWKVAPERAKACKYAIIHANNIVRGVYSISDWVPASTSGRFKFIARDSQQLEGKEFSNRNARSLFGDAGSGSQNPIRYVSLAVASAIDQSESAR